MLDFLSSEIKLFGEQESKFTLIKINFAQFNTSLGISPSDLNRN